MQMSEKEINRLVSDFARFYILTILYEGPTHGYDVIIKFRERVGKQISPGTVYPFLTKLEEKGIVEHKTVAIGEKEKKIYTLTERGTDFVERLFKRFAGLVSTALEPTLDICANCGCKLYEGGYTTSVDGKEMNFCCVHCAEHYIHEHKAHSPTN